MGIPLNFLTGGQLHLKIHKSTSQIPAVWSSFTDIFLRWREVIMSHSLPCSLFFLCKPLGFSRHSLSSPLTQKTPIWLLKKKKSKSKITKQKLIVGQNKNHSLTLRCAHAEPDSPPKAYPPGGWGRAVLVCVWLVCCKSRPESWSPDPRHSVISALAQKISKGCSSPKIVWFFEM